MKRKKIIWFLLLPAALAALVFYLRGLPRSPRYNLLLVSIDSLRADHLGCYGYPRKTSPALDALAEEGILFRNMISATSWTLPAHMSLLTSMDISVHGVATDGFSLHTGIPTLPEVLQAGKYATACFCSSPYLNPAYGFSRGFDVFHNLDFEREGFTDTVLPLTEETDRVHQDITSPRITELTLNWLEKHRHNPFFLFLHMWDVHYDYIPPPPYDSLFDPGYQGSINGKDYIHNDKISPEMKPRDLQHIIALYDGGIAYTDHYLGLIFQKLKELGLWDRTLVIVTADHGDEFFEHGDKGHRRTLYDEVIKVPLIIKLPRRRHGNQKISSQVSTIDVAATILDVAGMEIPEEMQGQSLLPPIKGDRKSAPRYAFSELSMVLESLRTNRWKLLYNREAGVSTILDLKSDPAERHTRLITAGPVWKEAQEAFLARKQTDKRLAERYRGKRRGRAMRMDENVKARLRALGYMK
jgi:arylsulfatase A-like enzyme